MTLVIGYGNPLRGDDGVGWAVAEAALGDPGGGDVVTVQALLPELAERVARSSRAVFVDARVGTTPGRISTDAIIPVDAGATLQGHALTPGTVVYLAGQLYGWKGDAWLVSRQSHARGWSARVDGREAPVRRANGKHLAVPVPAGRHEVELRYHPPGLRAGALLSLLGAALVVGVWWKGGPRR